MCSLITESTLTWWDTQDPEDELMALFNRSLLFVSANNMSLVELSLVLGSLAVIVGAWDCLHLREQEEAFEQRLAQVPDASFFLELYTTPETGKSPIKAIRHGCHYHQDVFDEGTVDMSKWWLEYCQHRHYMCRIDRNPELPLRLIDVSGDEPRLRVFDGGERGEYVCLSHRWGPSGTTFTTTQATLQERLQGIPESQLPPTFRDAVVFTRRLGYRYIWIDSLCIIQDSSADWENEAGKMGPYYQNAIVTISALQGQGPESGLGFDPRAVATTSVDLSDCKVWCRRIDPPLSYRHWTGLVPGTADVLLTRGWTMQESLLTPRILFFTKTQLVWHCNHSVHEFKNCSAAITPSESSPKLLTALILRPNQQQLAKRAICTQVPRVAKDVFFPDARGKKIVPPLLSYASVFYEPWHLIRARQLAQPRRGSSPLGS